MRLETESDGLNFVLIRMGYYQRPDLNMTDCISLPISLPR